MGRGPRLEQIEGGDRTYRVEIEWDWGTQTVDGCEIMQRSEAMDAARNVFRNFKGDPRMIRVRVVNERTGFASDEINRA